MLPALYIMSTLVVFLFFGTCRLGFSDHLFDVSSVLGSQGDSYIKHVFNLMERVLMLWIAGVTRA